MSLYVNKLHIYRYIILFIQICSILLGLAESENELKPYACRKMEDTGRFQAPKPVQKVVQPVKNESSQAI